MSNATEEKGILDEIYERYLECPICTEDYDGNIHIPRLLPCQHTYCTDCLRRLSNNAGHVTCAQCKAVSKDVPTVDKYPKDLTRCDLLDFVLSKSNCDFCKTEKAAFICTTCPSKLCQKCKRKTHKKRSYQHHIVKSLLHEENNSLERRCNKDGHENGLLKLYCEECQKVVCATCTFLHHRDSSFHTVTTLEMAVERISHTVTNIELQMSEEIQLIRWKYNCIVQKIQGRQVEKDAWKKLHKSLYLNGQMPKTLKNELTTFCDHVCNSHINLLKDKKYDCKQLLEQLQNYKKVVTRTLVEETDAFTFLSSREPVLSFIRNIKNNFYRILTKVRQVLQRKDEFDVQAVNRDGNVCMRYFNCRWDQNSPRPLLPPNRKGESVVDGQAISNPIFRNIFYLVLSCFALLLFSFYIDYQEAVYL